MRVRPTTTDVGRGEETYRHRYKRPGGSIYELPASGAVVPWTGREGHFWRRRLEEGAIELVEATKPKTKPKDKD